MTTAALACCWPGQRAAAAWLAGRAGGSGERASGQSPWNDSMAAGKAALLWISIDGVSRIDCDAIYALRMWMCYVYISRGGI